MTRNARGQIRRRGEGIWQISAPIRGTSRRRYQNVRGTKAQALDELDRLLRQVGHASTVSPGQTVADLIRDWIVVAELAETTRADYLRVINNHFPHNLARMKAAKVTAFDLDHAYQTLVKAKVGAHRIRRLHTILRRAFAQGVKWRVVEHNPVVDATPPRVRRPEIRPPAPAEVKALLAEAGVDLKLWLRLAGATGARRGELCGLRWEDLDAGGYLWIRRSVAYTPKAGIYVKETKTHQIRRVPLDQVTLDALTTYRDAQLPERTKPDCYLFSDAFDGSTPWRPDSTSRKVRQASHGTVHPHALRHFVATQLTAAGVDPRTVAERLGHERVSTTLDMYSHWAEGTGRHAADLMGDVLGD
jgi:integrase